MGQPLWQCSQAFELMCFRGIQKLLLLWESMSLYKRRGGDFQKEIKGNWFTELAKHGSYSNTCSCTSLENHIVNTLKTYKWCVRIANQSIRSVPVQWDECSSFPIVPFYFWNCIISTKRINGCERGSVSHNVLHTPRWDTGTSLRDLSLGLQLHVTAISFAYSHVYKRSHTLLMQQDQKLLDTVIRVVLGVFIIILGGTLVVHLYLSNPHTDLCYLLVVSWIMRG